MNPGARLEGLTKQYGVRLIVSESTWRQIRDHFYGRELDRIADWEKAMTAYRGRDWVTAERIFTQWLNREDDLTAKMYLKLIDEYQRNPPPDDWDAVSVMTTK